MTVPATKGDVETMIAPLATKADVAALPTRADVAAVDLRETVAALRATVDAQRDAQREAIAELRATVDAQRDAQREAIAELRATVAELTAAVNTQHETIAQVNTLGGRLDSLTSIVSPLVPCVVELIRPERMMLTEAGTPQLPESCEQARERARQAQ